MGTIAIASPALSDAATLTAGDEVGSFPAVNLQSMQPSEVWRSTNNALRYVEVNLGSPEAINFIALFHTNATSAAEWRVRAAANQADLVASPGYDSGNMSHWPQAGLDTWDTTHAFKFLTAAETYQWWRVDVNDGANAAYEAGRLYLANAWRPAINLQLGWGIRFIDDGEIETSVGRQHYPQSVNAPRELRFSLAFESAADMFGQAFEIDRLRKSSKDIAVVRDPEDLTYFMQQCVVGTSRDLAAINNPLLDLYEKSYRILELLP